ncbi:MAG: T9SS type A sorting domain-containing protein [Bacteroidota bacterium]
MKPALLFGYKIASTGCYACLLGFAMVLLTNSSPPAFSFESGHLLLNSTDCLPGTGYSSLFMGHSFFSPVAINFENHAHANGFLDHQQAIVHRGGVNGAPEALWLDPEARTEIQTILQSGQIDKLGMTYHPDFPSATGYFTWVDEALQYNANTIFFIGIPWVPYPENGTLEETTQAWLDLQNIVIYPLIDSLRSIYPENNFYAIPYGQGANRLRQLFEAGQLPDIQALIGPPQTSIHSDQLGHGGLMLRRLSELVWLGSIYDVDLLNYDYNPNFSIDLRPIAASILAEQDVCYTCGGESICGLSSSAFPASEPQHQIYLYPNPANDIVAIFANTEELQDEPFAITIQDIQGREMLSKIIRDGEFLPIQELKSGIYIYHLRNSERQLLKTGRLVVTQ